MSVLCLAGVLRWDLSTIFKLRNGTLGQNVRNNNSGWLLWSLIVLIIRGNRNLRCIKMYFEILVNRDKLYANSIEVRIYIIMFCFETFSVLESQVCGRASGMDVLFQLL